MFWGFFLALINCVPSVEVVILHPTTVIAKVKEIPRSIFYDIPSYVTMDTHLSFWHNVNKSVRMKCKITCRFHVFNVVLTLYMSYKHVRNNYLGSKPPYVITCRLAT